MKTRLVLLAQMFFGQDPSDEIYKNITQKCKAKVVDTIGSRDAMQKSVLPYFIRQTVVSKTEKAKDSEEKTRFICIAEAHESTRQRIESVRKRIHEEQIAGKGENCVLHHNSLHKFIAMLQAMKIPGAKAAVDPEWKQLETLPAWK